MLQRIGMAALLIGSLAGMVCTAGAQEKPAGQEKQRLLKMKGGRLGAMSKDSRDRHRQSCHSLYRPLSTTWGSSKPSLQSFAQNCKPRQRWITSNDI